jgi:hypothetical protein
MGMIDAKTALMIAEEKRNARRKEAVVAINGLIESHIIEAVNKGDFSCRIESTSFGNNWSIFVSDFIHYNHQLQKLGYRVSFYNFNLHDELYASNNVGVILYWNKQSPVVITEVPAKTPWWKLW